MSAAIIVLLLVVAVAQGENSAGPISPDKEHVQCRHEGITNIPVLPAGVHGYSVSDKWKSKILFNVTVIVYHTASDYSNFCPTTSSRLALYVTQLVEQRVICSNPTGVRDPLSFSVWAHFISRANAQKVLFGIFIRTPYLITFIPLYVCLIMLSSQSLLVSPSHANSFLANYRLHQQLGIKIVSLKFLLQITLCNKKRK